MTMAADVMALGTPGHPPTRLADMRHALPACIALSLAAHLLLLTVRVPLAAPMQAAHVGSVAPLRVRVIPNAPDTPSVTVPAADAPATIEVASESPVATHRPVSPSTPLPEPMHPEAATAATDAAPQVAPPGPQIVAPVDGADHDDYVPRPLLTVPPVALTPVLIVSPPGNTEIARRAGILSLFIDEDGRVQYITANDPALPPTFEQAARDAFMAARFTPGQINGRLVKSRVRVEVVFDNTPLATQ